MRRGREFNEANRPLESSPILGASISRVSGARWDSTRRLATGVVTPASVPEIHPRSSKGLWPRWRQWHCLQCQDAPPPPPAASDDGIVRSRFHETRLAASLVNARRGIFLRVLRVRGIKRARIVNREKETEISADTLPCSRVHSYAERACDMRQWRNAPPWMPQSIQISYNERAQRSRRSIVNVQIRDCEGIFYRETRASESSLHGTVVLHLLSSRRMHRWRIVVTVVIIKRYSFRFIRCSG